MEATMTLAQIAKDAGTTRAELRTFAKAGQQHEIERRHIALRNFIARAVTAGHSIPQIMAYVDRSEIMVTHALRMVCVDEYRVQYGQTLPEISRLLRAG
jgi:predicted transcriptional regulator